MKTIQSLQQADVGKMLARAIERADELECVVTIAITDAGGHLLAFHRMDGAKVFTANIGLQKARTAAMTEIPTLAWMQRVEANPAAVTFPDVLAIQGGLPIIVNDICVGGIGVSGAASDVDEAIAQAAIDAIT